MISSCPISVETHLTPFFFKRSKTDQIGYFASFRPFFGQKRGKCHPISILRPDLESSHQGASFRHQNERRVTTLFFDPHCNFKTFFVRGRGGDENFRELEHCQHVSTDTGHDKIIGAPRNVVSDRP